jgi:hypothetical protein
MNIGKCPHCQNPINDVILEPITAKVNPVRASGGPYKGVACLCPSCQRVLSISLDPKALEMKGKR